MSPTGIEDEFQEQLRALQRSCAGDPRRELLELLLIAVEREQLVSVGYREALIEERLAAMPLPEDLRALIRRALVWVWKDEEMHTIYVRGALLRFFFAEPEPNPAAGASFFPC